MEVEISTTSNCAKTLTKETSDSNIYSRPLHHKCPRHGSSNSASRFKGVVFQQNGNWGAQIYANRQRIWLGTFKSEIEAAMAYDSAAIKLRIGDSPRNFGWSNDTIQEPEFQRYFSLEAVLNMIKDGSYPSKFSDYLRMQFQSGKKDGGLNLVPKHGKGLCKQLFQKELTPSDVGKLNRLVIPKKYALRYFPRFTEDAKENPADGGVEDAQLIFYDRLTRSWKFRYCYWKSSQSYVFTRGWNRFVKENPLKEKDIVIFSLCECQPEGSNHIQRFCMIDVAYYNDRVVDSNASRVDTNNQDTGVQQQGELQLDMERDIVVHGKDDDDEASSKEGTMGLFCHLGQNAGGCETDKEMTAIESTQVEKKGLRIFGVQLL